MDLFENELDTKIQPDVTVERPLAKDSEWRLFFRRHRHLKRTFRVVGTSLATSIVVIAIVSVIGWKYRANIAAVLISTLPPQPTTPTTVIPVDVPKEVLTKEPIKELTIAEVVAKVNPSVVSIEVFQTSPFFNRASGKGTGFFVSSDGLIITNRHVINVAGATYTITTSSGKKYTATLIAKDPVFDLAVLKVVGTGFPAVTLGNSNNLVLGQSVVAIGFALGQFQNSISAGVISGLSRSIIAGGGGTTEQLDRVIQTDAAINPGNSGGPLINLRGEVIGVNVAVAQGSQSVGFAIPSDNVIQVVNSVKAYGFIVRPYLGISYTQLDESIQKRNNLSVDYGIFINSVVADSPAARVDIRSGDIILAVDGVKLDGDPSFSTVIRNKKVGQNITITLLRNGVQTNIKATLIQSPDL